MASQTVTFQYLTGINSPLFSSVRLSGSWNLLGHFSDHWTEVPMQEITGPDGCPAFQASITLQASDPDQVFRWGVVLDSPIGLNQWGIPTEIADHTSTERFRTFRLNTSIAQQMERYYFTYGRRLGANKVYTAPDAVAGLQFAVWAPHARQVDVVFGQAASGYIDDQGGGIDPGLPVVTLQKQADDIWQSDVLMPFADFEGLPYMFRLVNAQGNTVYRTDIFSRSQIGCGATNPKKDPNWSGTPDTLDGTISCSIITDPDTIRPDFAPSTIQPPVRILASEFWAHEFTTQRPIPDRVEDLVIYELHIGALGFGQDRPGNLADAIELLDYLSSLGVNAVELLPMAEFSGSISWGYGDTHHFVIESSAGGRDQYRHFVRACHQRGIAVIQDVVYNHYDPNSERAQWQYDSELPEENIYYWYEGRSADYPNPDGGYVDNGSSGWTPRFWEEVVRHQFISSAAFLVNELHVDGLRVDLTQAIHRDNQLHKNGDSVGRANLFGQKLLREWSRTLKAINPRVFLIAEDHTGWSAVTKPPAAGGLGFDATWFADFYHSLIGDSTSAGGKPRLVKQAGFGQDGSLSLDQFATILSQTQYNKVVFHESHDEAGNADGTARTMTVAVNGASLQGATRTWAEMRSRLAFGLSILSAGTPMFFMGEEIGAQKPYRYDTFMQNREDLSGDRLSIGAAMFRFYQDLITLSRRLTSIRGKNIDVLHAQNNSRVIAFKRWRGEEQVLVVASFHNSAYSQYIIRSDSFRLPDGGWKEIFNSDGAIYGGFNVGNAGATLPASAGTLTITLPANGFIILVKQ